jgi:lipopolysaccharide/colanic/teichoic acid biosynthesis glycosyltransferase
MAPQPYGDDSAYTFYPACDASLSLGWGSESDRRPISIWRSVQFFSREYVLSNVIFVLLFGALFLRTWIHRAWELRLDAVWRLNIVLKRGFDIAGATVGLILSLPFFVVLPIIIKLDSPGPVFFRQERVGINRRRCKERRVAQARVGVERRGRGRRRTNVHGRPFEIIKFRTMVQDAEKKCGPVWATANDPRITRFGQFMRKTRLDEIPQLWNVLKGEMSLVGPRPERLYFVEKLSREVPDFLDRLQVTPGITGLAQVKNGYDSSVESVHRKITYDLKYIRGWNIIKDLRILCATVIVVITGRGAC